MNYGYSYQSFLTAPEEIHWRIEDIIGGENQLDFGKPFMPESLARVGPLKFLSADEKRILNQIRGNTYLCIFGLVEEFILPFVLDHARPQLQGDDYRVRALLQFASEEAKHIQLFKRFRQEFENSFGTECSVIGPPEAIAKEILAHSRWSLPGNSTNRVDVLAPLYRQRQGRPGIGSAIQEPVEISLDGRGAARQARHSNG